MRKILTLLCATFVCALQTSVRADSPLSKPWLNASAPSINVASSLNAPVVSPNQLSQEIAEAKRLLGSRPTPSAASVTLAALDTQASQINFLSVPKDSFLVKGADLLATTQLGRAVRLHVIRPNGVNTAVTVTDTATGRPFVPLVVEYPIAKSGAAKEVAFYTSGHPALLSPEIASAGEAYVTTMLNQAATRLAQNGVTISPDIVDVAEHLVIVEHTDHKRFLDEEGSIYPEILSLYALNQGDTYRYSVSSAGAGGMIQMIPRTYEAIRQHHKSINLESDFIDGMRDHANALEAMLLYINDTWKYLENNPEVQSALRSGAATKAELLAAGYNSNPYRLPLYLSRGGAGWRALIPAETQMYLAIYSSVDSSVQFKEHAQESTVDDAPNANRGAMTALMSSISQLLIGDMLLDHILF